MATLTRLDNVITAFAYQSLTFPLYRACLQKIRPNGAIVAVAATDGSEPIGLALAALSPQRHSAEILSLFVVPEKRRQGIGTALLTRIEQELTQQGCTHFHLVYTTAQATTPALERLLQKCGWTDPQPRMLVCKSTLDRIAAAPWMQKYTLPSAYTIFPWSEITAAEWQAIHQQQKLEAWIPPDLVPERHQINLEPLNSVGVRYQGQVVGWVLTHRLDPDTIRYTCSFIRRDLQKMGRIIPLYIHAIQRQAAAKIPNGIWTVPYIHPAMIHFVKQRMAPYLISIDESRESTKA